MPAFDAGAFSAAFDAEAPDITTAVHRAVLEVLADLGAATVHRVTAEAVAVANGVRVLRGATEVIKEHIPSLMGVHRTVVEVLRPDTFELPDTKPRVRRVAAEVLAWAVPNGLRPKVVRSTAEVVASAATRTRGLELPSIAVDDLSVYMALTPDTSSAGSLGLLTALGEGFSVQWEANASELVLRWKQGPNNITWTQPLLSGPNIIHYAAPTPGLVLAELGLTRPEGYEQGGTLHEVLVLDNPTPGDELRVQRYLEGRWQGSGATDPCELIGPGVTVWRATTEVIRENPAGPPPTGWTLVPTVTSEGAAYIAPEYAALVGMAPQGTSDPAFSLTEGGVVVLQFAPAFPVYSIAFFTPVAGFTGAVPSVTVDGLPVTVSAIGVQDATAAGLPWPGTIASVGLTDVPSLAPGVQIVADITWS